jgi:hypothetical protein
MAIMGFITIFMMASSFGIHLSLSIMMDDLCARASDFITQPENVTLGATADQALQIILTCLRNGKFSLLCLFYLYHSFHCFFVLFNNKDKLQSQINPINQL